MDHCFFLFWSEPVKMITFPFLASLTRAVFLPMRYCFVLVTLHYWQNLLEKQLEGKNSLAHHFGLWSLDFVASGPWEAQHHGREDVGGRSESFTTWWAGGGDRGQGMSFKGVSKATCFHVINSPLSSELTNELAQCWCQQPNGQSTACQGPAL